jgi:hypothetical protein
MLEPSLDASLASRVTVACCASEGARRVAIRPETGVILFSFGVSRFRAFIIPGRPTEHLNMRRDGSARIFCQNQSI